jgi:Na+/H+ antiporter NhaD/arsenite permease-like protein
MTELCDTMCVFRESNMLVNLSRSVIVLAWMYGLVKIWGHRGLPHANQALVGAVAMVLSNSLILFRVSLPYDVLLFFVAMSQLVLAISFSKLFSLLRKVPENELYAEHNDVPKVYMQCLTLVTGVGIAGMFVQALVG